MVCFFSSLSRARSLKEGKGKSGQYHCWWLSNAVAASSRKIVFKIRSESSRHALCTYHYVDKVYHSQLFILSLMVGFVLVFFSGLIDAVEVHRLTSVFTLLKAQIGLRLRYDGRGGRVYLQLDSHWRGQNLGLCGTFNGNLRDDFLWAYPPHQWIAVGNLTVPDCVCMCVALQQVW